MLPAVLLCLGLVACDGDLAVWLERAGSGDWAERERAQRWLATHLETADAPALAARAASGGAELCARLARAIGGEARHVELAAALALRAEPAAAELGREALREQLLEWDPGAESAGAESLEWLVELRRASPERLLLGSQLRAAPPAELLDLVVRRAGAPALVLDPRVVPRELADPAELTGTLPELMLQCAAERGLRVLGFGFGPQDQGRPWILFAPAASPAPAATTAPSGVELLSGWVIEAADPARAPAERSAAGRALAATGWPAALTLLERRWRAGDEAALDGLLLAAGQGRVAPALQEPARQRALYAQLGALVAEGAPREALRRASAIARALGAAGAIARSGEALGTLALEGFEAAGPREQWLRLCVLEGAGRAFPEALAAADRVLGARTSPAPLTIEALRVRAALAGAAPLPQAPADPLALLDWAADERARTELRELWSGLSCAWPAEWSGLEACGSALRAETRGLLLEIACAAGAEEHALAHARALFAERSPRAFEALVEALARSRAALLAARLPAASPAELSHAAAAELLAGLPPSARAQAELARWLSAGAGSAEELLALASQAASARGADVRAKLLESLGPELPLEARVAALERAARELQEHEQEAELEHFSGEARERARALADAELRTRLRPGRWPPVQRGGARDLGRDERELEHW